MDRAKVIDLINTIMLRTSENGCTEAEVLEATRKIDVLLRKYDLSLGTVKESRKILGEEAFGFLPVKFGTSEKDIHEIVGCAFMVAQYYDCRCWQEISQRGTFQLFGSKMDVIMAKRTLLMLAQAMDADYIKYIALFNRETEKIRKDFSFGFVVRINERFMQFKEDRNRAHKNSKSLITVKDQIIRKKFISLDLNPNIGSAAVEDTVEISVTEAYTAGRNSGGEVELLGTEKVSEKKKIEKV